MIYVYDFVSLPITSPLFPLCGLVPIASFRDGETKTKQNIWALVKGRYTGGLQTGWFPDLDLSFLFCLFLSFLGLSRFVRDFPDLSGDSSGIFPICPFPLSRPIKKKAPMRNSPERVRDTVWTFPKNLILKFGHGEVRVYQRYGCIPRSAANNLGQIPQKLGAPNPLF